jgi:hypothetical protein
MLVLPQMLHGTRFAPGLQFPFSQGQYPVALGFKSPTDLLLMLALNPASPPTFTPSPTLSGVPAPCFVGTKQTNAQLIEAA